MTESYKNLGQAEPASTILTNLYIVPVNSEAVVSSIIVCNTSGLSGSGDYFRISNAPNGAADNIRQYIYRDVYIPPTETFVATVGITMASGDVIRCYSQNGNCSFNLYGTELS